MPQVQAYCADNFSHWDPMITTLPGLYSVSWIAITVLERGLSATGLLTQEGPDSVLCSTPYLRGQNVLFLVALFVLLYKVIVFDGVHEQEDDATKAGTKKKKEQSFRGVSFLHVLQAFNLSTFPVLFFFCCLYYTDLGATCFVLLGYYCTLKGWHITSAVVSEYSWYCILCVRALMNVLVFPFTAPTYCTHH